MKRIFSVLLLSAVALPASKAAQATGNQVSIDKANGRICITTNGLPNHRTGRFPNRGNPHTIRPQRARYCVTQNPVKSGSPHAYRGSVGVALNGVAIRPGTADYWDPRSPRKHSRDRSSGWNLEGIGAKRQLGMDASNAHVDERGLYHYHGVPTAYLKTIEGTLVGYAADGFEIHYVGKRAKSGWTLKKGTRPAGPGGRYDGTYVEDWQYSGGPGTLDQCNGGTLDGKFVYFATDTYPFYPRCLWGQASADFRPGR